VIIGIIHNVFYQGKRLSFEYNQSRNLLQLLEVERKVQEEDYSSQSSETYKVDRPSPYNEGLFTLWPFKSRGLGIE